MRESKIVSKEEANNYWTFLVSKPEVWNDIMQLMDHNDQRKQDDNSTWQLWLTEVVPKLEEHFPDTDIRDALRILGIGITNSANLNLRNGGRGTGLYPTFARINHRCICNTKSIKHSDQKYVANFRTLFDYS